MFSPNLSTCITFAAAPLVLTPFVGNQSADKYRPMMITIMVKVTQMIQTLLLKVMDM